MDFDGYEVAVDYIYLSDGFAEKVINVKAWTDEHTGIYLSDHYPVCAEIEL